MALGLLVLVSLGASVASGAGGSAANGFGSDWLSYGGNAQLTNYIAGPAVARAVAGPAHGNSVPRGLLWTTDLDGAVYASPLAVGGVATATGIRDLVVAETEAGTLYALDAHDGSVVWQRSFRTETTAGCGKWGLTSTGAIDKPHGILYVATARGFLHAIQLSDGAEQAGWPTRITSRPLAEYVWGGLRVVDGRVYVPVASYCDVADPTQGLADGRLVGVDQDDPADQVEFDPVIGPNNLGGLWGYSGVSASPNSSTIYTAVGNSAVTETGCNCTVETAGYGDDVVALTPDLSQVVAADRPPYIPLVGDADFGASPLVFRPTGCPPLVAANNKNGNLFVWNSQKIESGPIADFGLADSLAPFIAEPSWDPATQTMYDSQAAVRLNSKSTGEGIAAVTVGANCVLKETWLTQTGTGLQTPPLIVGQTVYDGTGDTHAVIGLDARTGKIVWRWNAAGNGSMTAPLIEAGGLIIAADTTGAIRAFQLL
jgi:outer membrane protein assembly factor BamB